MIGERVRPHRPQKTALNPGKDGGSTETVTIIDPEQLDQAQGILGIPSSE